MTTHVYTAKSAKHHRGGGTTFLALLQRLGATHRQRQKLGKLMMRHCKISVSAAPRQIWKPAGQFGMFPPIGGVKTARRNSPKIRPEVLENWAVLANIAVEGGPFHWPAHV